MGAAGAASDPTYVDDVFSTYVYEGTGGSTKTITNGIDLSGEGGLVWIKRRDSPDANNILFDTVRGVNKVLFSDLDALSSDFANSLTAFSSSGFSLGSNSTGNASLSNVSWTFRKAPGFFDVVTYTGDTDGTSAQLIPHSLGSVPGMMIVKCTNTAGTNWRVYHRSLGATKAVFLDLTNSENTSIGHWNNTAPTSTHFTVGPSNDVNANGDTYVAYLFAHDNAQFGTDGDESIIKCGSYTGNASTTAGPEIDLGFEPQWLMVKRTDNNDPGNSAYHSWIIQDNMRGLSAPPYSDTTAYLNLLFANKSVPEGFRGIGSGAANTQTQVLITPTGFAVQSGATEFNDNGGTYIYMAIRRPNKPPTDATEVFSATTYTGNATARVVGETTNLCDLAIIGDRYVGSTSWDVYGQQFLTRLIPGLSLASAKGTAQSGGWHTYFDFDEMKGLFLGGLVNYMNNTGTDFVLYNFKRAPGFFDVVTHLGTGSARQISHNLNATPGMIICKLRDGNDSWAVQHSTPSSTQRGRLNIVSPFGATSNYWNDTEPTSTVFTVGSDYAVNWSGLNYITYLFATLPGISKVGSYSGDTGNAVNVDCGFSAGARFVLIKRSDDDGDWYVWDTARGIVSGNDPYLLFNTDGAEVGNTDYIDPLSSGFTVTASAPAALNVTGGTYIFLAIA